MSSTLLIVVTLFGFQNQSKPLTGIEIERRMIDARDRVRFGSLDVSVLVSERSTLADAGSAVQSLRFHLEFDNGKVRSEQAHCRVSRLVTPNEVVAVDNGKVSLLDAKLAGSAQMDDAFDPRMIGLGLTSIQTLDNFRLHELHGFADRTNEVITDESIDGLAVQHLSYDRLVGCHVDLWIAPQRNWSLIRGIASEKSGSGIRDEMDVESGSFPGCEWFPKKVAFRQVKNDRVTYEEVVTVEAADFRLTPDQSRFALSSLKLEPGTIVTQNGVTKYWDGTEIKTSDEMSASVSDQHRRSLLRVLLCVNAVGLALAALFFTWRRKVRLTV